MEHEVICMSPPGTLEPRRVLAIEYVMRRRLGWMPAEPPADLESVPWAEDNDPRIIAIVERSAPAEMVSDLEPESEPELPVQQNRRGRSAR